MNEDFFLKQELDEEDDDFDYFVLKHSAELTNYNGAENSRLEIRHELPYSVDDIEDWEPGSDSGSSWSASLPGGASWNFSTSSSVNIDTSGSSTDDYAIWEVYRRAYQTQLVSPCRIKPGTAWLSKGTLAAIDTQVEGIVNYEGRNRLLENDYEYRYNYD